MDHGDAVAKALNGLVDSDAVQALAAIKRCVQSVESERSVAFARAVVSDVIYSYWSGLRAVFRGLDELRELPLDLDAAYPHGSSVDGLARTIGQAAARLDATQAGYAVGSIYTGLLPKRFRAVHGAYYTPPALCERLLDLAEAAGVDWSSARVLDPACGGGAFLAPVARRMVEALGCRPPAAVLSDIQGRLAGFELDPFAAWMSQVFLDAALVELCNGPDIRLEPVVQVSDSLERHKPQDRFDLVIGNPPYGRVKLSPELRAAYQRSLFGHANLYGVFTDLALRHTQSGGVIAYVTPTSFLSGEYFKALRGLLGREAPPIAIDFISQRKGIFADVLQETMLAVYQRSGGSIIGHAHLMSPEPDGVIGTEPIGSFKLPDPPAQPWLIPRAASQVSVLRRAQDLPFRLCDYGYTVSTGPLVWNRHKSSLRRNPGKGRFPLVWAESVRPDGAFEFRAERHNHQPYFQPTPREHWVVTDCACALVQRTTAKEQARRLVAAELPSWFIEEHGAVVVENHLNMIKPLKGSPKVSPAALVALLNSEAVDQVFRCINGSVAVSAYELQALPLPAPDDMKEMERLVRSRADRETLEREAERLYSRRNMG
ncbi:MAG: N-6 DNA methylase [Caldilineaceae bacterium SB0664_bin_22]|nr:N-6 DNA methylase [Caldilineaceae bacterium SB0664_bin_22]MYC63991.1 N-6 DNA methylase [Caldilineaceae bacterium SB0661_bin_34]